jgi:hypothetical protein
MNNTKPFREKRALKTFFIPAIFIVTVGTTSVVRSHFLPNYNDFQVTLYLTIFIAFYLVIVNQEILTSFFKAVVATGLVILVFERVYNNEVDIGDIELGISNAAFFGSDPDRPIHYLIVVFTAIGLISVLMGLRSKKWDLNLNTTTLQKTTDLFALYTSVILSSQFLFSRMNDVLDGYSNFAFDPLNNATWDKLYALGGLPMRNFWYPYGNMLIIQNGFAGAIISTLLIFFIYFTIIKVITNSNLSIALKIFLSLLFCNLIYMDSFSGIRYGFPILALLNWVLAGVQKSRELGASLMLGVAFFISFEVSILTFLIFVAMLAFQIQFGDGSIKDNWRIRIVVPGTLFTISLFIQYILGGLAASIALLLNANEMTSLVTSVNFGLRLSGFSLNYESMLLILILLLVCFYFTHVCLNSKRDLLILNLQLGLISIIFVTFALLKQFTRGGMLIVGVLACLPLVFSTFFQLRKRIKVKSAASVLEPTLSKLRYFIVLTTFVLVVFHSGSGQNASKIINDLPSNFSNPTKYTENFRKHFFYNFFPTFEQIEPEFSQLAELSQSDLSKIFVLGNRSTYYWQQSLTNYWTISNWATKSDAKRNLKILQRTSPDYIFFDTSPGTLNFDLVGSTLRDPELFNWVIRHYKFYAKVAGGDLLVRKLNKEIDFAYFASRLGFEINIGALGYAIPAPNVCPKNGDCESYLKLENAKSREFTKVPFVCSYGEFNLIIDPKFDRDYYYPLNNLWFWSPSCYLKTQSGGVDLLSGANLAS